MQKKLFPWLIALSAFSVSGSAAFYSVYGLGKMFAGATLEVMILAGSLEFAKLVTASLLYQYWKSINALLKTYLLIATLVLIGVTSAGIYGFLSSAYQETAFKLQNQGQVVNLLDQEKSVVESEIKTYQTQLEQKNNRVTQLTNIRSGLQSSQDALINQNRSTSSVRRQIKDIESEIKRMDREIQIINDSISSKNKKIASIEIEKLEISSNDDIAKEIGPLKYIAGLTGKPIDVVVNWYILVLMLVFDPLAISLVIAANFAFEKSKEQTPEKRQEPVTNVPEDPSPLTEQEEEETKDEENNEDSEKSTELEEVIAEDKKEQEPVHQPKTKKIIFESGQVKKIELEKILPSETEAKKEEIKQDEKIIEEKIPEVQKNLKSSARDTGKNLDKYSKYIEENTPGFKGYKHNTPTNDWAN